MKNLTKNERVLAIVISLYTLANGMSAVFMNVFLYAYTGSLIVMSIYTIIRIAAFPFIFTLAGKLARKTSYGLMLTVGLVFMMLQLIFVLGQNELIAQNNNLVFVAALLFGIGEGFFWLSVNTLNQLVTTPDTRNTYVGLTGVLNNVSNVVAPLIASFIIQSSFDDMIGYSNIFKIVLVVYALIALLGFCIKEKGNPIEIKVLKLLRFNKDSQWKYCLTATFLYGLRDSLILTLAGLLVYNATNGNGSAYGQLLSLFAVLSILSYCVVSRKMRRSNRMRFYGVGAVLIASSTIVLVLFPTIEGAMYYGIVNAIATPMFANPYTIIGMNIISDYAENENLVGRVIVKETYMSLGRCLGMGFIILLNAILPNDSYLIVSVIILSMMPIVLFIYASSYHKKRELLKLKEA